MRTRGVTVLIWLALSLASAPAKAQPAADDSGTSGSPPTSDAPASPLAPSPAPSSPGSVVPPAGVDIVYLNDGTSLSGFVVQQDAGKFVIIRTAEGGDQTLDWSIVQRVSIAPRTGQAGAPSPPAAAAPVAPPWTTGPPLPESRPYYEATRRNSFVKVGMEAFGTYQGFGPYASLGVGLELATTGFVGLNDFPGKAGGSWSSLAISVFLRGWDAFGLGAGDSVAGLASVSGGGKLGYSYMHFGGLNDKNRQAGVGFMASFRLGYQGLWEYSPSSGSGASLCYGPSVALTFPRYSARDGSLKFNAINFSITVADPGHVGLTQYQLGWGRAF